MEWEKIKETLKFGLPPIKWSSYKNRFNLILDSFKHNQSINKKKTGAVEEYTGKDVYCSQIMEAMDDHKRLELIEKSNP